MSDFISRVSRVVCVCAFSFSAGDMIGIFIDSTNGI